MQFKNAKNFYQAKKMHFSKNEILQIFYIKIYLIFMKNNMFNIAHRTV